LETIRETLRLEERCQKTKRPIGSSNKNCSQKLLFQRMLESSEHG